MNKLNHRVIVIVVAILVVISVIAFDQTTKRAALEHLKGRPPMRSAGSLFVLIYAENTGAFLSMGRNWPSWAKIVFLQILPTILLLAIGFSVFRHSQSGLSPIIGLSLILGGGLGNLFDRITRGGAVIDFLNIGIGRLRTGIFNVADLAVLAGSAVLIIGALRADSGRPDEEIQCGDE